MLSLIRQRNFFLLWFGGFISVIGDWMLRIALPVYVFETTGSTLATGIMFMVSRAPQILLGSIAGVFADRWNRKWLMIISNLLFALTLSSLLLVQSTSSLWIVYLGSFIIACISQFFAPAASAFLPEIVGEKQLLEANSLNALTGNLARLVGPGIGGLVIASYDLSSVVMLDIASFCIAALMIALIKAPPRKTEAPTPATSPSVAASWRAIWQDLRAGLAIVKRVRSISLLFTIASVMAFGEGFFTVLFVPFVDTVLRGDGETFGWLISVQAIGGLVGSILIGGAGKRFQPAQILGWSCIAFGFISLTLYNVPMVWSGFPLTLAFVLMIIAGAPGMTAMTSFSTLLQMHTREEYRGRIFGAYSAASSLMSLAGIAVASGLGDLVGVWPTTSINGAAYILAGLLALFLLHQRLTSDVLPRSTPSEATPDVP